MHQVSSRRQQCFETIRKWLWPWGVDCRHKSHRTWWRNYVVLRLHSRLSLCYSQRSSRSSRNTSTSRSRSWSRRSKTSGKKNSRRECAPESKSSCTYKSSRRSENSGRKKRSSFNKKRSYWSKNYSTCLSLLHEMCRRVRECTFARGVVQKTAEKTTIRRIKPSDE